MYKTWEINDGLVLGRTSKVFWKVEKVFTTESGNQYGLTIAREFKGRTLRKIIPTWRAIPKQI